MQRREMGRDRRKWCIMEEWRWRKGQLRPGWRPSARASLLTSSLLSLSREESSGRCRSLAVVWARIVFAFGRMQEVHFDLPSSQKCRTSCKKKFSSMSAIWPELKNRCVYAHLVACLRISIIQILWRNLSSAVILLSLALLNSSERMHVMIMSISHCRHKTDFNTKSREVIVFSLKQEFWISLIDFLMSCPAFFVSKQALQFANCCNLGAQTSLEEWPSHPVRRLSTYRKMQWVHDGSNVMVCWIKRAHIWAKSQEFRSLSYMVFNVTEVMA